MKITVFPNSLNNILSLKKQVSAQIDSQVAITTNVNEIFTSSLFRNADNYDHQVLSDSIISIYNKSDFPLKGAMRAIVLNKIDLPLKFNGQGDLVKADVNKDDGSFKNTRNEPATIHGKFSNVFKKKNDTKISSRNIWGLDKSGKISVTSSDKAILYQLVNKCLSEPKFNIDKQDHNIKASYKRAANDLLKKSVEEKLDELVNIYGDNIKEFEAFCLETVDQVKEQSPFRAVVVVEETKDFITKHKEKINCTDFNQKLDDKIKDIDEEKKAAAINLKNFTAEKDIPEFETSDPKSLAEFINNYGLPKEIKNKLKECAQYNPSLIQSLMDLEKSGLEKSDADIIKQLSCDGKSTIESVISKTASTFPQFEEEDITDYPIYGKLPFHAVCTYDNLWKVLILTLINIIASHEEDNHFLKLSDCDKISFPKEFAQQLLTSLTLDKDEHDIKTWKSIYDKVKKPKVEFNFYIHEFMRLFSATALFVEEVDICCLSCKPIKLTKTTPNNVLPASITSSTGTDSEIGSISSEESIASEKSFSIPHSTIEEISEYTISILKSFSETIINQLEKKTVQRKIKDEMIDKNCIDLINSNYDLRKLSIMEYNQTTDLHKIAKFLMMAISLSRKVATFDPQNKLKVIDGINQFIAQLAKIFYQKIQTVIQRGTSDEKKWYYEQRQSFADVLMYARTCIGNNSTISRDDKIFYPEYDKDKDEYETLENIRRTSSIPENTGIDLNQSFQEHLVNVAPIECIAILGPYGSGKTTYVTKLPEYEVISNVEIPGADYDAGTKRMGTLLTLRSEQIEDLKDVMNIDELPLLKSDHEDDENVSAGCGCCKGQSLLVSKMMRKDINLEDDTFILDLVGNADAEGLLSMVLRSVHSRIDLSKVVAIIDSSDKDYETIYNKIQSINTFEKAPLKASLSNETSSTMEGKQSLKDAQSKILAKIFQHNEIKTAWYQFMDDSKMNHDDKPHGHNCSCCGFTPCTSFSNSTNALQTEDKKKFLETVMRFEDNQLVEFLNQSNQEIMNLHLEYLKDKSDDTIEKMLLMKYTAFTYATHININPQLDKKLEDQKIKEIHTFANADIAKKTYPILCSEINTTTDAFRNNQTNEQTEFPVEIEQIDARNKDSVKDSFDLIKKSNNRIDRHYLEPEIKYWEGEVPDDIIQLNIDLSNLSTTEKQNDFIDWITQNKQKIIRGKGFIKNEKNQWIEFQITKNNIYFKTEIEAEIKDLRWDQEKKLFTYLTNS